ncbi:MAG: twin-arginine translocase TatA/TatE family subunit [Dehalococcoidia bacterium]|jgi:sec-independent protein translocase protein TatB
MNFLGVGTMELIVVLGLALLILGPKRMIEASRSAGKLMRDLRRQRDEFTGLVMSQFEDEDEPAPAAPEPAGAVGRSRPLPSAPAAAADDDAPATADTPAPPAESPDEQTR